MGVNPSFPRRREPRWAAGRADTQVCPYGCPGSFPLDGEGWDGGDSVQPTAGRGLPFGLLCKETAIQGIRARLAYNGETGGRLCLT